MQAKLEDRARHGVPRDTILSCAICSGRVVHKRVFAGDVQVRACTQCGTEQLYPLPTAAQQAVYYTDYPTTQSSDDSVDRLIGMWRKALGFYLGQAGLQPSKALKFLDVGCGNGASVIAAAQLGLTAHGIDLDGPAMRTLQRRITKLGLDASCEQATLEDKARHTERYDVLKLSQVIEHVIDPLAVLAEAHEVLLDRGVLIIDCPNNDAAFWLIKNALRTAFGRESFYNSLKLGEHLWGFTRRSLTHALRHTGFEVVICRDYAMRDARHQPETAHWYPSLPDAVKKTLATRRIEPMLWASIGIFDSLAARTGYGMGLVALARRV